MRKIDPTTSAFAAGAPRNKPTAIDKIQPFKTFIFIFLQCAHRRDVSVKEGSSGPEPKSVPILFQTTRCEKVAYLGTYSSKRPITANRLKGEREF